MRRTLFIKRIARSAVMGFAVPLLMAVAVSCSDDEKNSVRDEYIKVYPDPYKDATSKTIVFGVSGGLETVYVRSNIDFTAHWENSGTEQWVTVIDDNGYDEITGCRTITLLIDKLSNTSYLYTKRTGTLVLKPTEEPLNFNTFITCNQGSVQRLGTDFSWLTYGDVNPDTTGEEMLMDYWTTIQQEYYYSSTVIAGEEHAYCYGRNGYIQLGDNAGHGADIITPNTTALYQDSLLVVSFNAVAYVNTATGQMDGNKLTVEVEGGGVIRDYADRNGASIQFAVPYYDPFEADFPDNMWKGTNYLVFVQGTDSSPITAATKIRITSGSLLSEPDPINNRIFLDNIFVYSIGENEEDYFKENGGSGLDYVLGGQ